VIAESTGAPPERRWGVQLTDYTLMALRADGVPREVLEKLGRIRGSAFNSERTFLEALAGKLTPEELDRYRVKLLYHAQHSGAEPQPEMVLFSPARFVMRTGSPIMSQPEIKAPKVGFLRRIVWPSIDLTEFGDTERKFLLDLVPQPDAGSLKDEELIEMIEKDIEDCLLVFQESSTLKDQYRPEEAESLYRLGQYLVILRWPEIKTALGRARARKGQQPE